MLSYLSSSMSTGPYTDGFRREVVHGLRQVDDISISATPQLGGDFATLFQRAQHA